MSFANGSIVTVLRDVPGGLDQWNDPVPASISRTDIAGCGIAPRYSSEPTVVGRQGVIVGLTLYVPAGTDILFTDRIEINGGGTVAGAPVTPTTAKIYVVEGEAADWTNPITGTKFPTEIALKRATG